MSNGDRSTETALRADGHDPFASGPVELTTRDLLLVAWLLDTALENNPGDPEFSELSATITVALADRGVTS